MVKRNKSKDSQQMLIVTKKAKEKSNIEDEEEVMEDVEEEKQIINNNEEESDVKIKKHKSKTKVQKDRDDRTDQSNSQQNTNVCDADLDVIMTNESHSEMQRPVGKLDKMFKNTRSSPNRIKVTNKMKDTTKISSAATSPRKKLGSQHQTKLFQAKVKICEVCFQISNCPLKDSGYDMIECKGCKFAHTNAEQVFECLKCLNNQGNQQCEVCLKSTGLMSQIIDEENQYVHVICGLISDLYEINDFGKMTFKKSPCFDQIQGFSKSKNYKNTLDNYQFIKNTEFFDDDLSLKTPAKHISDQSNSTGDVKLKRKVKSGTNQSKMNPDGSLKLNKMHSKLNLPLRGGKVSVVCDSHRSEQKSCVCNFLQSDPSTHKNSDWIMCDYCEMWFHNKCIGLGPKELKEIDKYVCSKCESWSNQRMMIIAPALVGSQSKFNLLFPQDKDSLNKYWEWKTWGNEIFPKERYKLKLIDMIFICQIWSEQAKQLISHYVTSELSKQQLLRAQYIPLNTYSLILGINEKIEKVIEYEKQNSEIFEDYSYQDIKPVLIDGMKQEPNIEENQKLAQKFREVIDYEEQQLKLKSQRCEELEEFYELIETKIMLSDILSDKSKKISLEDIDKFKQVYARADGYKCEMKSQLEKLVKEGKEAMTTFNPLIKKTEAVISSSIQDIVKTLSGKKSKDWIQQNVFDKFKDSKIDYTKQFQKINLELNNTDKIASDLENAQILQDWIKAIQQSEKLIFTNQTMTQQIEFYNKNKSWINQYIQLIDIKLKNQNKVSNLIDLLSILEKNQKERFVTNLIIELKSLQTTLNDSKEQIAQEQSQEELQKLLDTLKAQSIRPENYQDLKLKLKICKWLDKTIDKPLSIDLIENYTLDFKLDLVKEKLKAIQDQISVRAQPYLEKVKENKDSLEQLVVNLDQLEKQQKLIEINNHVILQKKDENNLVDFKVWITKIYTVIQKKKLTPSKGIIDQIQSIKKEEVLRLISLYKQSFNEISQISHTIYQQLNAVKHSTDFTPVSQANSQVKIDKAKLEKQKKKYEKSTSPSDAIKLQQVELQLKQVNGWYKEFKSSCCVSEVQLRKELKANPKKVLELAQQLLTRKWARIVVDSDILMSDKNQTEVGIDRIYEIDTLLERIKVLDEIDSVRMLREELDKLKQWHEELDKVTEYDESGLKVIKVDVPRLKQLVEEAKNNICINISSEINEIEQQIKMNEDWDALCDEIIKEDMFEDWLKIDKARKALDQAENDPEEVYTMIDRKKIRLLRIWYIKAKYHDQQKNRKDVIDFILAVEREINKLGDFNGEMEIEHQVRMVDLAKRIRTILAPKISIGTDQTKKVAQKTLTLEDAEFILENKDILPFKLEKKQIENLSKQKDIYYNVLDKEVQTMYQQVPQIEAYEEVLKKLQDLLFITPHETFINKMKKNYQFIQEMMKRYPPIEDKKVALPSQKSQKQSQSQTSKASPAKSEISQYEEELPPRFIADFQKVHKKYFKLKCICTEAQRLIDEYEVARQKFDNLKSEFLSFKLGGKFTYEQLQYYNEGLIQITLDFDDEELQFRQEIWHTRVNKILQEHASGHFKERLNSEQVRFWLEEGQELEVVNDVKYEKLNELVEDIDHIARALKMCASLEEIEYIEKQENQGLIEMNHLLKAAKQRIEKGIIPKYVKKGNQNRKSDSSGLNSCAIEYLKNCKDRRRAGEMKDDVDMDGKMIEEEEGQPEDDDDMDTDNDDSEGKLSAQKGNSRRPPAKRKPVASDKPSNTLQSSTDKFSLKNKLGGGGIKKPAQGTQKTAEKTAAKPGIGSANKKRVNKEVSKKVQKDAKQEKTSNKEETKKKEGDSKTELLKQRLQKKKDDDSKTPEKTVTAVKKVEPVKKPIVVKEKVEDKTAKVAKPKPAKKSFSKKKKKGQEEEDEDEEADKNVVEEPKKPLLKMGGNSLKNKLGSPAKSSLLNKKKFETPKKQESNQQEDKEDQNDDKEEKMEVDEGKDDEKIVTTNKDNTQNKTKSVKAKPKKPENTVVAADADNEDTAEESEDKGATQKKEQKKPVTSLKSKAKTAPSNSQSQSTALASQKTNNLLGKRPAADKTKDDDKKKPAASDTKVQKTTTASTVPAASAVKKVGLIKKPGGGGLAASLAKINK